MSSKNNNTNGDGGEMKKEPIGKHQLDSGVSDEENPPALSTLEGGTHRGDEVSLSLAENSRIAGRSHGTTQMENNLAPRSSENEAPHCGGDESSFLAEKRLIAGRSCVPKQMEMNSAIRSTGKEDPNASSNEVSAKISYSRNLDLQAKQKIAGEGSSEVAAATSDRYAYPFEDEAKEEELEATRLREVLKASSIQQMRPGAFAVRGSGFIPQDDTFLHVNTTLTTNEVQDENGQLEQATMLNAILVDDPEIASASIVDQRAEGKAQCRRQMIVVLATTVVIGIIVYIIVFFMIKSQKKPESTPFPTSPPTGSSILSLPPSDNSSSIPSLAPSENASIISSLAPSENPSSISSLAPSNNPSASPSKRLFGFLAEHSFDNGTALSTNGSSQQKAMTWVEQSSVFNITTDYIVLQFYALAVFYYATGENTFKQIMVAK